MSAASDYLEDALINFLFRDGTFTKPSAICIALCTDTTTDAHTGATLPEVANAYDYARVVVGPADADWAATSGTNGLTSNVEDIEFATANGGDWGTITHFAILDAGTHGTGNVLVHGPLTASKVVSDGDTFRFSEGDLQVSVA